MEISIETQLQKNNGSKYIVSQNEESILKKTGKNNFGLIKNEIKPTENKSLENIENQNKKIFLKNANYIYLLGELYFYFWINIAILFLL